MNFLESGVIDGIKPTGGGWRYEEPFAGRIWRIPHEGSAKTAEALVEAVKAFRLANGLPAGDPFYDVCEYIKKVSPRNDRWKGRAIGQPRRRDIAPIIHELRQWIDATAQAKPRFVLNEDAANRALVCITCPQNIRWEVSGCGACNEDIETRSYALRQARKSPGELALKACRLHRVHLPAAITLDRDFLPARHPDAPPPCWVQDELRATHGL